MLLFFKLTPPSKPRTDKHLGRVVHSRLSRRLIKIYRTFNKKLTPVRKPVSPSPLLNLTAVPSQRPKIRYPTIKTRQQRISAIGESK